MAAKRGAAEATLLAFDYGEKRIGVALGNVLTHSARALTVISNKSREYRFEAIGALLREWQPDLLVVGLPRHPDGTPHAMTQLATRFGNQLNGRFNLPVVWVDERYSSVDAEARLRERGERAEHIDAEAACVILQQYLDEHSSQPL
ncbi:putative Holliday junction resolvase [Paraburkholderia tropica]|nr:putative Holliday junction resolvase [Paraburkholderia tropica]MBB6316725.1 putative Holliday junction resolvase [Paraburkholderia tropica]